MLELFSGKVLQLFEKLPSDKLRPVKTLFLIGFQILLLLEDDRYVLAGYQPHVQPTDIPDLTVLAVLLEQGVKMKHTPTHLQHLINLPEYNVAVELMLVGEARTKL